MARLLAAGEQLGDWLIQDRLLGTWGVVYVIARQGQEGQEGQEAWPGLYVAKTLRPNFADDMDLVARFELECYQWLSLGRYKHWVPLLTVDRFNGQAYAIAEHVPEVLLPNTLRGWLRGRLLEAEIALRFGVQICRGLSQARDRGLEAHQDLKPENIMITEHGVVKLTDWGLSRISVQLEGLPSTGEFPYRRVSVDRAAAVQGSRRYAAPELGRHGEMPGPASDLFSLGVVLVEMLGGESEPGMPAARILELLRPVNEKIRKDVSEALAACLAPVPQHRPRTTEDLETVLCSAFEDLMGVPMEPAPPSEPDSLRYLGTRSYGLFMLGRLDEAMHANQRFVERLQARPGSGKPAGPSFMLLDYKEHGWKMVAPNGALHSLAAELDGAGDDRQTWRQVVSMHHLSGSIDRALELSLQMLDRWPDDPDVLVTTARLYASAGRPGEGTILVHQAMALESTGPNERKEINDFFIDAGDAGAAREVAARSVARHPDDSRLLIQYGHLLSQNGEDERALAQFEAATRVAPDDALAWYNLGTVRFRSSDADASLEAFTRAVDINPEFAVAFNSLGSVAMHLGRLPEATAAFQRAIAADQNYARPHFNLGQIFELTGQSCRALAAYRNAFAIDPGHVHAQRAIQRLEREA